MSQSSGAPAGAAGRERWLGLLLVVVSAFGYGSGALFAKPVYASGVDWLTLSVWRFLFAALASWAWLLLWPSERASLRRLSRRRLGVLLALGVFFVGNTATYYAALETVPASLAALIVYIYPALVAVISLRFGRRLQGRRPWIALAMATAGVGLALGGIDPSTAPGVAGLVLAVASPIIYAVWIVLAARLGGERQATDAAAREETDPAPAATVMITATLAAYLLLGGVAGARLDPRAIPAEAWIGLLGVGIFSTAVAIQGFYAGVRRIGAAQASLVSTVEPVYTIALATLLFGEVLTPVQVLGGILVIAGVLLAQTSRETGPERPLGAPAPAVRTSDAA